MDLLTSDRDVVVMTLCVALTESVCLLQSSLNMNVSRITLSVDTSCVCVSHACLCIDRSNRAHDWMSTALGRFGIESIKCAFWGTSSTENLVSEKAGKSATSKELGLELQTGVDA